MTADVGSVIRIEAGKAVFEGNLYIPPNCLGLVILADDYTHNWHHSYYQTIAQKLSESGLGTLQLDLLNAGKKVVDRESVDAIALLADRLIGITGWLKTNADTHSLRLGYFGAAGAVILAAAAQQAEQVYAVVACGGRPDLADAALAKVQAATLLIAGGNDADAIQHNQHALSLLRCQKQLEIIPNTTQLFAEPDALEAVANLALRWFKKYLSG